MAPKLTPTQSPCRGGKEDSWWGGQPGHWVGTTFSAFIHHLCAGPGHMLRSVVGAHSHWLEALSSQHCQARRGPRIGGLRRCLSTHFPHGGRGAVSGQGAVRRPEGRKGRVGTGCRASMGQARARGMGRGRVGADAGPLRTRLVGRGGAWCAGWEARGRRHPGSLRVFGPCRELTLVASRGRAPRFASLCWGRLSRGGGSSTLPLLQSRSRQARMGKERARVDRPVSTAWWGPPRGGSGAKGRTGFRPQSQR